MTTDFGGFKPSSAPSGCWFIYPDRDLDFDPLRVTASFFWHSTKVMDCDCRDIGLCPAGPPPHPPITEFLTDEQRAYLGDSLPEPTERVVEDWNTRTGFRERRRDLPPPAQRFMSATGTKVVARDWKEDLPHCDEVPFALVAADGTPAPFDPSKCKSYAPKKPQSELQIPEGVSMVRYCAARAREVALTKLAVDGIDTTTIPDEEYREVVEMLEKLPSRPRDLPTGCNPTVELETCSYDGLCDSLINRTITVTEDSPSAKAQADKFLLRLGSAGWNYLKGTTHKNATEAPKDSDKREHLQHGPRDPNVTSTNETDDIIRDLKQNVGSKAADGDRMGFRHGPVINKNVTAGEYGMWNTSACAIGNFLALPGHIGHPSSVNWDGEKAKHAFGAAYGHICMALYLLATAAQAPDSFGLVN